ncbi:hypothetical protein IQ276_033130 [Desmonostoc muscorum LEGE 12446]|uniref:hypothetical protein n=1 Tax=Desmonostoc muscorum TaxID=1179 RepID=UPI001F4099D9|nr:hypothetical protein [Desmonostoc muscorum]MCF2151185.1 hypothetical protein [Desmonostoc muscorum LEGE 12446]
MGDRKSGFVPPLPNSISASSGYDGLADRYIFNAINLSLNNVGNSTFCCLSIRTSIIGANGDLHRGEIWQLRNRQDWNTNTSQQQNDECTDGRQNWTPDESIDKHRLGIGDWGLGIGD